MPTPLNTRLTKLLALARAKAADQAAQEAPARAFLAKWTPIVRRFNALLATAWPLLEGADQLAINAALERIRADAEAEFYPREFLAEVEEDGGTHAALSGWVLH